LEVWWIFCILKKKNKFIMYKEKLEKKLLDDNRPTKQPEHLSIAQEFANQMIDSFNPEQVNEIMHHIRQMFIDHREMEIAETQKKLAYLKNTIEAL
jgi:hypothetical protein